MSTKVEQRTEPYKFTEHSPVSDTILDKWNHLGNESIQTNDSKDCSEHSPLQESEQYFLRKRTKKEISQNFNIEFRNWIESHKNRHNRANKKLLKDIDDSIKCMNVWLQNGYQYNTLSCKKKHCLLCQNNRTGKLINGYLNTLDKGNTFFVTLTKEAVKPNYLNRAIDDNIKAFSRITQNMRKQGTPVKALRTIETTHNLKKNTFHTHIHALIEGKEQAEKVVLLWLNQWTGDNSKFKGKYKCSIKAQDIRKADEGSYKELLKYFTKLDHETDYNALTTILRASKNRRLFQAYGVKKDNTETLPIRESKHNGYKTDIYVWDSRNWYNAFDEPIIQIANFKSPDYAPNDNYQTTKENTTHKYPSQ